LERWPSIGLNETHPNVVIPVLGGERYAVCNPNAAMWEAETNIHVWRKLAIGRSPLAQIAAVFHPIFLCYPLRIVGSVGRHRRVLQLLAGVYGVHPYRKSASKWLCHTYLPLSYPTYLGNHSDQQHSIGRDLRSGELLSLSQTRQCVMHYQRMFSFGPTYFVVTNKQMVRERLLLQFARPVFTVHVLPDLYCEIPSSQRAHPGLGSTEREVVMMVSPAGMLRLTQLHFTQPVSLNPFARHAPHGLVSPSISP
jgi:hypothetical protein